MAAVSGGAVPGLSQIQNWQIGHLEDAATHWSSRALAWEESFTDAHQEVTRPGGRPWEGAGADAAYLRTGTDKAVVSAMADSLHSASAVAREGASEISWAKQSALTVIEQARGQGFSVGEDLSVTDRSTGFLPAPVRAARQIQAEGLAAEIRAAAQNLVAVDTQVGTRVTTALAGLNADTFGDPAPEADPTRGDNPDEHGVRMVDFHGAPLPEKPSWVSPDPPPGGWSDDPITRAAQKIAYGHASTEHLVDEWPPGTTREQMASQIEGIMRAGADPKGGMITGRTKDGAPAIYDPKTNTIVIRDQGAADAGTAFKPTAGQDYLTRKMPTRVPSIPVGELADAPKSPPIEPPKVEPPTPRVAPRGGGFPPMVGVPPLIDLPGPGAGGEVPILDSDGTPDVGMPGAGR